MKKKLWIIATLLLVLPGLMFLVSCATPMAKLKPCPVCEDKVVKKAAPAPVVKEEPKEAPKVDTQEQALQAARTRFQSEHVYFAFDSSTLDDTAQMVLRAKADFMKKYPDATVTIEGHCDERGTNAYNLALGDRRAESAKAFLVDLGIDAGRMGTVSYGEEQPVDAGHDEEAWAKNRRAHFVLK